jgi:endonuclease/exonuclease/phosphatase family metal-dependent hydrolase
LLSTIDAPAGRFRVLAAHLSHRSESVRVASARLITQWADEGEVPLVVAGDLNSTPPGFPGHGKDASGNNAVAQLDVCGAFRRRPDSPPEADRMTFHSTRPRVVIDWILIPDAWRFRDYRVILSELSDHRPVVADMVRVPAREPD